MASINVIVTETGEYEPTPELLAVFKSARLRKDRQPDLRTKAGKLWRELFKEFRQTKMREYLRG